MKAKMQKPAEEGVYLCVNCDSVMAPVPTQHKKTCTDSFCVLIYIENDEAEESYYTKADWHGG